MNELAGYAVAELIYNGTRTLVYRGKNPNNSLSVILKKLRREYPTFNELLQFRHQYVITKNLDLPGIVQPIALEKEGNSYVLVMADVGGVSLSQYYKNKPLSLEEFFPVALALCQILSDLYQNRIIHKDIKPENILINPETKEIFLIDFSIASLLPRETQTLQSAGQLEGTLAYISPEQTGRMNRGIDYRSDFYSLGVTFYKLLTGQLPFNSDDAMELVHCHIAKKPTLPHTVKPEIPEMLSALIMKLMAKTAETRYQSAKGLEQDLNECWQQWQKSGKVSIFELGQKDKSDRLLIPEKLYGRQTEVKTLLNAFDKVAAGTTEMMLVAGFSGIGKTAVVNEVHKPIVEKRGYFIQGKFDQFNRNIPLSAFVIAFRDLMGQLLGESDIAIEKWKGEIIEALGEQAQVIIDVIPELESIIGEQPEVSELSGSAAQNRFNLLFGKFIQVFATRKHPLVIFLDDLQWADSASLNLLKLLMNKSESGYLLVLGAYRDNEVYPAHPLMLTLEEMGKTSATINTITLAPLSLSEINLLVADTLSCGVELAQPLTELVYQKTKGNPFFTNQFLKSLYEDGWFQFNFEVGYWQCDITRVRELSLTDDVVEFMATRISKLPEATREVLKLAACIGNQFDLETLGIVSVSPTEAAASLWVALREGLVLPTSETYKFYQQEDTNSSFSIPNSPFPNYKFLHDRVQQAAYSLIPEEGKKSTHLKIGQLLSKHIPLEQREEKLFEIVNQLNYGIELIEEQAQRYQLAQFNLQAGKKAKTATAYGAAVKYAALAMELLAPECWQERYELTLALYNLGTESAYLNGDFARMEVWARQVLASATSVLDRVKVYTVQILAYIAQQQLLEAVEKGLEILKLLGFSFPSSPTETEIEEALAETAGMVREIGIEALGNQPRMTDATSLAAMKIAKVIIPPAAMIAPSLCLLTALLGVKLSIMRGNAAISAYTYSSYGTFLFTANDIESTYQFGKLALKLLSQFDDKEADVKTLINVGAFTHHWKSHLKESISFLHSGYLRGTEIGELDGMAWNGFFENHSSYFVGQELPELRQKITNTSQVFQKVKQELQLNHNERLRQVVLNLMGETKNPCELTGEAYNEGLALERYREANDRFSLHFLYLHKAILCYLFEDNLQALENANYAASFIDSATSQIVVAIFYFYQSLVELSRFNYLENTEREVVWQKVGSNQEKMRYWANYAPMNFQHKFDLVAAEQHRLLGENWEAMELYDRAIAGAKENDYLQEEALANELAAKFYLNCGKEKIARTYMTDAYYCYSQWGAKAKVADLEKRYRQLLAPIMQQEKPSLATNATISKITEGTVASSGSGANNLLDFSSAFKASMVIAGEIELEGLLSKLMETVMENAGATKSAFLLPQENTLVIEAIAGYSKEGVLEMMSLGNSLPVESNSELPQTIINTVKRSEEALVINDLSKYTRGASDSYLLRCQPQSILCLPLLDRGQMRGILYLENQVTPGAFTSDRLELLKVLAAQAAISLENARLYQSLEQKVAERTIELNDNNKHLQATLTELKQTQAQLIQTEKMSSLGRMVGGIAHEINNPTTFILGNLHHAQDYVRDLLDLIEIYQEDFPDGSDRVSEKLEEMELDYLKEDLEKMFASMKNGCSRISSIVQGLRTFSRLDEATTKFTDLHANLDSTLMLLEHRLLNSELGLPIEVIRQYGTLPEVTCNISLINQVFFHIISNAIDAICSKKEYLESDPPAIKITTETVDGQRVKITISDNGEGMSEETRAKIFDPFFSTKPVGKGTGLGLSTSYQIIVAEHGGTLSCSSELLRGTKLTLTLPVVLLKSLPTSDTVF